MEKNQLRRASWMVGVASTLAIALQLYWNIENYRSIEQNTRIEMQEALNRGTDRYYLEMAKDMARIVNKAHITDLPSDNTGKPTAEMSRKIDSIQELGVDNGEIKIQLAKTETQSQRDVNEAFISSLVISIKETKPNFEALDKKVREELHSRQLDLGFELEWATRDTLFMDGNRAVYRSNAEEAVLLREENPNKLLASSSFLPQKSKLILTHQDPSMIVLKRGLIGALISILVSAVIIYALYFLNTIMLRQKEVASIKDDFINNMTHEFKTPIATVSSALEAIQNFSPTPKQQQDYLHLSKQQLDKLNTMVERVLEVSMLTSEELILNKETTSLTALLSHLKEVYSLVNPEKDIQFIGTPKQVNANIDPLHFSNAIGNLLDNALKYGGGQVILRLDSSDKEVTISVEDNGGNLKKHQLNKIFDKFYRIPQGNRHDVKGYGIGLFYVKEIIEKHRGKVEAVTKNDCTIFKVILPYE